MELSLQKLLRCPRRACPRGAAAARARDGALRLLGDAWDQYEEILALADEVPEEVFGP